MTMRTRRSPMLLLVPLVVVMPPALARTAPADCPARAIATVEALAHHDHDGARRQLDAQLQAHSQQMEPMWDALVRNNWGSYRSHGAAETSANAGGVTTVRLPIEFEHGRTTATVTCSAREGGAISEFSLL